MKEAAKHYGDEGIIFPAPRGKALVNDALVRLMRDCGVEEAVPHGFRSSFRVWAAEHGYEREVAEAALAHRVGGAVELAYKRTDYLAKRRKMMKSWAEFCMGNEERR